MSDPLAFLDMPSTAVVPHSPVPAEPEKPAAAEPAPAPVPQSPTPEAPATEQKTKVEEPKSSQGEEELTPIANPEPGYVPLNAVLGERDRRKKAEEERDALKKALEEQKPQFQLPERPDPEKDPDGAKEYDERLRDAAIVNERMHTSERFARLAHPAELVDKARDWAVARFEQDAAFAAEVVNDPDPYGKIVKAYQTDQKVTAVQSDWDDYLAWKAQKDGKGAEPQKAPAAAPSASSETPPPPPPAIPSTIADATSQGGVGSVPTGPGQAFANIF